MNISRTVTIAILAITAIALPALAQPEPAESRLPTITKKDAERGSRGLLRTKADWRYANHRELKCNRGRISRIAWACRFAMVRGNRCTWGRIKSWHRYNDWGRVMIRSHASWNHDCEWYDS